MDTFMNALSGLEIENLSLNPPFGITTAGIESIMIALKGMTRLTSLMLDFSQTRALDDVTMDLMTSSLMNLTDLTLLSLNISDTP